MNLYCYFTMALFNPLRYPLTDIVESVEQNWNKRFYLGFHYFNTNSRHFKNLFKDVFGVFNLYNLVNLFKVVKRCVNLI